MSHSPRLEPSRASLAHASRCAWFWAWAVVGCGGALSALVLGPLALVSAPLAGAIMVTGQRRRTCAPGVLAGIGGVLLYVAFVQRAGPGTSCWHTATAGGCDQHSDPFAWLAAGALLVLIAFLGQLRNGG